MRRKMTTAIICLALLAAAAFGIWWVYKPNLSGKSTGSSTGSGITQKQPAAQTGNNQPPQTYKVSVYFSRHPESDNDPSRVFAVGRTSPDLGVAKFAITELFKGPTPGETAQGYFTTTRLRDGASNCGADFKIGILNGTATLTFCRPFDHLGVVADGQADSELKTTLKQFSGVDKVIILNYQGNCEFDLSGQDLCRR